MTTAAVLTIFRVRCNPCLINCYLKQSDRHCTDLFVEDAHQNQHPFKAPFHQWNKCYPSSALRGLTLKFNTTQTHEVNRSQAPSHSSLAQNFTPSLPQFAHKCLKLLHNPTLIFLCLDSLKPWTRISVKKLTEPNTLTVNQLQQFLK